MRRITELHSRYPYIKDHLTSFPWLMKDSSDKKRVHIIGLGDVGSNVCLGLRISSSSEISSIGIFDTNQRLCERIEIELNQVLSARGDIPLPGVHIITNDRLFDCDIFLMCAATNVPPIGAESRMDVRMAQYESNRKMIIPYALIAEREGYRGLFGVVSDPVDLLCSELIRFLHPDQIQGFGLGVMNARSSYYASKRAPSDKRFSHFPQSGRVYGPHGNGLVAANSILPQYYNEEATEKLSNLTVGANIAIRSLGYKPYIAPAISSVSMTIPEVIAGNWNDSARYLNGVFFGARNRTTMSGTEWEKTLLPDDLFHKLEKSYTALDMKTHKSSPFT